MCWRKDGDYYEAAKSKCSQSGGHLANLAELKVAKSAGKLPANWYLAYEETGSNTAFVIHSTAGNVNPSVRKSGGISSAQVICIGN